MKQSRFLILQATLFGVTVGTALVDNATMYENPSLAYEDDRATPTVSRHRVLRRHLQGHPAFAVGALGNVGMPVPHNPGIFAHFAGAAGAVALGFLEANKGADLFSHQGSSSPPEFGAALTWAGDMHFSLDGGAHVRLQQTYDDLVVQGGNILVHTDGAGNVVAVNGEYVDCNEQVQMLHEGNELLLPELAFSQALKLAGMDETIISQTEPEITLVVGEDLTCCLAYQSTVDYWETDVLTNTKVQKQDILYTEATQGRFCAREPLVMGNHFRKRTDARRFQPLHDSQARRILSSENSTGTKAWDDDHVDNDDANTDLLARISTYFCRPSSEEPDPTMADCELVSNSPTPISSGELSVDSAHNYALATFNYYWHFHGLNSLDGNGYELISFVLSDEFKLANGTRAQQEDLSHRIFISVLTHSFFIL